MNLIQTGQGFGVTSSLTWLGSQVTTWINSQIDQRMVQAGNAFVARAQALAPVDTGALRSGIDFQVTGRTLTIISTASYTPFVEFGTRRMMPHPFLRPALNDIGRILGFDVEILMNSPAAAGTWSGVHAHQGGFVVPHNLTAKQRTHVAQHLLPVSRRLHRGNVKRAKVRVRRFG